MIAGEVGGGILLVQLGLSAMQLLFRGSEEEIVGCGQRLLGAQWFLPKQDHHEQENTQRNGLFRFHFFAAHGNGECTGAGETKKAAPFGATLFKEAKWRESEETYVWRRSVESERTV